MKTIFKLDDRFKEMSVDTLTMDIEGGPDSVKDFAFLGALAGEISDGIANELDAVSKCADGIYGPGNWAVVGAAKGEGGWSCE